MEVFFFIQLTIIDLLINYMKGMSPMIEYEHHLRWVVYYKLIRIISFLPTIHYPLDLYFKASSVFFACLRVTLILEDREFQLYFLSQISLKQSHYILYSCESDRCHHILYIQPIVILPITMASKHPVRQSAFIDQPEQFVTVEIHNSTVRKKLRNHRESIINEMKHTQTLLEQALNRNLQPHPHSRFTPADLHHQPRPHNLHRTIPSTPRLSRTTRGELSKKLKQLCNISQHFDRACEYRQSVLPTLHTCESTPGLLPFTFPREAPPPSPTQRRAKEELVEHKTMVRDWQAKVRLGRDFVKRAKVRHPLKLRKLNQQAPQVIENNKIPSLSSLRDLYFSELRPERRTAPLANNRSLEMLFLRRGDERGVGYVGEVQQQSALRLQRFIEGGQEGLGEYSDWLSLSDFRRSKENYQMLERLYNHVKQTNLYEFKDMPAERLKQQSLLSVVYYLQHGSNLSQGQRRALRKKLRVVQ